MTEDLIRYDVMVEDALRGVVKEALRLTAKEGLLGEHHFYITFRTGAEGVILSKRLLERYPNEMTVVLQHRFWDMKVEDERFEVTLTFNEIPEKLVIPFEAIVGFADPSVRFGLQFGHADSEIDTEDFSAEDELLSEALAEAAEAQDTAAETGDEDEGKDAPAVSGKDNKVVTLDAFRKKT